jgi:translation initiation factor 2B subunit (eIF-2B alpha/beta/delta family)
LTRTPGHLSTAEIAVDSIRGPITGGQAIAAATVALAQEQRTANLIAYLAAAGTARVAYQPSESVLKSVQAEIEERLGLV